MGLNANERNWLNHMTRWGSDGYPVRKLRPGRWVWDEFFGIKGAPTVYKTKKAAMAAVEAYEDLLIDKHAGRI